MNRKSRSQAQPSQMVAGNWRKLALLGALALSGLTFWLVAPWVERMLFVGDFDFTDLEQPAGFRQISTGDFSGALDPLAGVSGAADGTGNQEVDLEGQNLCQALFAGAPTAAVVQVAYFSDYRCPYCGVLSKRLAALEEEQPQKVSIAWHESPIFGRNSELAARAALAARRQDAYAEFHERLMRTSFVPTPAYLRNLSEEIGIDPDRLLDDMQGSEVEREIAQARALAAIFGFPGTPGLVVGRTVVVGAIGEGELRALVERERAAGPIEACR